MANIRGSYRGNPDMSLEIPAQNYRTAPTEEGRA
jgi:hypothetical protein